MLKEAALPEETIEHILTFLPVKYTCVSKRFHSLILSNQKFAQSQFRAARDRKTNTQRLLYTVNAGKLESLDLDTPLFGDPSTVRELRFPSRPPARDVSLLCSWNGILFLGFGPFGEYIFYMWNPSTGFLKQLPDPDFLPNNYEVLAYGIGAHAWETLEVDSDEFSFVSDQGILLKEALHWVDNRDDQILAFDLGQEETHKFRKMLRPRDFSDDGGYDYVNHLGVSAGGCLSVAHYLRASLDYIDVWVMGEYGVRDSWTKLLAL
ncbi:hypothetical protein ACLB2K_063929 [Fragaria x ananassa]